MQRQRHLIGICPSLAADFAWAAFWDRSDDKRAVESSAVYASQASTSTALVQLRLLRAAHVVLGVSTVFGVQEAVQRLRREMQRKPAIYADKAFAFSNRLGELLPTVSINGVNAFALPSHPDYYLAPDNNGWPVLLPTSGLEGVGRRVAAAFYTRAASQRLHVWPSANSRQWRVGRLYSRYIQGDGWCTATAIGRRWLLTAAHCFFEPRVPARKATSVVYLAHSDNSIDEGIAVSAAWSLHLQHEQLLAGDVAAYVGSDLALVQLATPLEGAFKPPILAYADSANLSVELLSFPIDTPPGSLWLSQCRARPQREQGGVLGLYALDCANQPGQSGALLRDAISGGAVGVLSVNISGNGVATASVAGVFTPSVLDDIERIRKGMKPRLREWQRLQF